MTDVNFYLILQLLAEWANLAGPVSSSDCGFPYQPEGMSLGVLGPEPNPTRIVLQQGSMQ